MRRMMNEVVRNRKRVLVVSTVTQRLPASGTVVVGAFLPFLLESIAAEYQKHPAVYAAKAVGDRCLRGFSLAEIETLKQALLADFLLIDLGEQPLAPGNEGREWLRHHPWDQMVCCLDITQLDRPAARTGESAGTDHHFFSPELFRGQIQPHASCGQVIFGQPWPALLFFNQVNMLPRESRAILLSRELRSLGVQHVALGNLQANTIKRLQLQ